MFERFEEEAVRAILAARDEACHLGHGAVGPEHLLVGLARTDSRTVGFLQTQSASAAMLVEALKRVLGQGEGTAPADLPFTAEAQRAIARSWSLAEEHHHGTIEAAHLLLAVLPRLGEDSGVSSVLLAAGLDAQQLLSSVKNALAPVAKPRLRAGFQEDDLEVSTPYGPVTLTLLRRPESSRDTARVISLSADTLSGPDEIRSFLSDLDRLLDATGGSLGVSFLRDLFGGLGTRLSAYLKTSSQ